MPAKVTLAVTRGKLQGQVFTFGDRTTCLIGRADDCQLRLLETCTIGPYRGIIACSTLTRPTLVSAILAA